MSPETANPAVKTTRAARLQSYGGPEAVRVDDLSLPEPKAGEVLVKIYAAGVNPVDWKIRAGYLQQHMPLQLPVTLGSDFAGVIEAVGPDVKDFKVDDEVYGGAGLFNGGSGSFAHFATTKADSIAAKPRKVNFTEAGALPLVGVSALLAFRLHVQQSTLSGFLQNLQPAHGREDRGDNARAGNGRRKAAGIDTGSDTCRFLRAFPCLADGPANRSIPKAANQKVLPGRLATARINQADLDAARPDNDGRCAGCRGRQLAS